MKWFTTKKLALLSTACFALFAAGMVYASNDLGSVASNISNTFKQIATVITGASFLAGLGFAIASILKFKAHKDNPTQIPVGTPIALLFIAAALIFLPALYKTLGTTVFGSGAKAGTASGTDKVSGT